MIGNTAKIGLRKINREIIPCSPVSTGRTRFKQANCVDRLSARNRLAGARNCVSGLRVVQLLANKSFLPPQLLTDQFSRDSQSSSRLMRQRLRPAKSCIGGMNGASG